MQDDLQKIMNSFHNIKYKTDLLKRSIVAKGYGEEFEEEIYDVDIALGYINEMIKAYTKCGKKGVI